MRILIASLLLIASSPTFAITNIWYNTDADAEAACEAAKPEGARCQPGGFFAYYAWDVDDTRFLICRGRGKVAWPEEGVEGNACIVPRKDYADVTFSLVGGQTTFAAGDTMTFSGSVSNIKELDIDVADSASLTLSTDGEYDWDSTTIGSIDIPPIAAGDTYTFTNESIVVPDVAEGDYTLVFVVNPNDVLRGRLGWSVGISEANYENNLAAPINISISSGVPDLTLTLSVQGSVDDLVAGSMATLDYTVTNSGDGNFSTSVPLDISLGGPGGTTSLTSTSIDALIAGAEASGTIDITLPTDLEPGDYQISGQVNPGQVDPAESDYGNNVVDIPFTITPPDLTLTLSITEAEINPGEDLLVDYVVVNAGGSPFDSSVPLSLTLIGEGIEIALSGTTIGSLEPGASDEGDIDVTIPDEVVPGNYDIVGVVNPEQVAPAEAGYANNENSVAIEVIGPDLTLSISTVEPEVEAGGEVTFDYTVNNVGKASFPDATPIVFTLNGDTIGETTVTPPAPQEEVSGSIPVSIPEGTERGTYTVFAEINPDRTGPVEQDYGNNRSGTDIQVVAPDLTVDISGDVPGEVTPNQDLTITVEVKNEGDGDFRGAATGELLLRKDGKEIRLDIFNTGDIEAGSSEFVTVDVRIPADLIGEGYELIARLTEAPGDADTGNNVSPTTIAISVDESTVKPDSNGEVPCANPIIVNNGVKTETEIDYQGTGPFPLQWARFYRSSIANPEGWSFSYSRHLLIIEDEGETSVVLVLDNGQRYVFEDIDAQGFSDPDVPGLIARTETGYGYLDEAGTVHEFDQTGRLTGVVSLTGFIQTLQYQDGRLAGISDQFGKTITLTHDADEQISAATLPDGRQVSYVYNAQGLLTEVILPDETPGTDADNPRRQYLYESPDLEHGLTGIIDENGVRYATFAYNESGQAILSSHDGLINRTEFSYLDSETRVTNALGKSSTFFKEKIQGVEKIIRVEGEATFNCPAMTSSKHYDDRGYVTEDIDKNGNITLLTYAHTGLPADEYLYHVGLVTSRTEAAGTAEARTTTIEWHPTHRLPVSITEPGRKIELSYDSEARLISRSEIDLASGARRTWTNTYDNVGLLIEVDGPRTDVSDITSLSYNSEGELTAIVNALGHRTQILAHDANGLPQTVEDPNGPVTHLGYDERLRLVSQRIVSTEGETNTFISYDDNGNVTSIKLPDGQSLNYSYDLADRLTSIRNDLGEAIEFELDNAGNRVAEVTRAANGSIVRRQNRVFDELSRLINTIGAAGQTSRFSFDNNNNLQMVEDALGRQTHLSFDGLDRLIAVTDALQGMSTFTYDERDNLTSVTDAAGVTTSYEYDGLNNLVAEASTARGTTTYRYDSAGNRTESVDANGVIMTYAYDALNRLTAISYSEAADENITYGYDAGDFGLGRLTEMMDVSGETSFSYDDRGNLLTDRRVIHGKTYATRYVYNLANQLVQVVYPSGRIVNYTLDSLSRVIEITTQNRSAAKVHSIATGFDYLPFGPATAWQHGNGLATSIDYDEDYRVTDIDVADLEQIMSLTYEYNDVSNITALLDNLGVTSQSFGYDALNRLTAASGVYGEIGYTYDGVGNRLSRTIDLEGEEATETYLYESGSHRPTEVTTENSDGVDTRALSHDENGNTISDINGERALEMVVNARNRLTQVVRDGKEVGEYSYNALGQRVAKVARYRGGIKSHFHRDKKKHKKDKKSGKSSKDKDKSKKSKKNKGTITDDNLHVKSNNRKVKEKLHFHYDQLGNLIAESTNKGQMVREYIYLGNYRIAMLAEEIDTKPKKDKSKKSKKSKKDKSKKSKKDKSKKHSDKDDDPKKQKTKLTLYFLHNDHLGTTRKVTDSKQRVVWSSAQTPFGEMAVDIEGLRMPMRFPGQYADLESGYSYNYFRDYDPRLGRYIQSDPIGLLGGYNEYTFVKSSPISRIDPFGLVDYVDAAISVTGMAVGAGEVIAGGFGLIVNGALVGTGAGAPVGVPGWVASTALVTHGSYNYLDSWQGLENALNETNHAGPAEQFGEALFGEQGAEAGKTLDTFFTVRGALKAGAGFVDGLITGNQKAGDVQGVSRVFKDFIDQIFDPCED